jgi:hypothetical protein
MVQPACCVLINNAQTHIVAYQLVQPLHALPSVGPLCLELPVMFALRQVVLLMNAVANIAPGPFAQLQVMC